MNMSRILAALGVLASAGLMGGLTGANAAAGGLDQAFGSGGIVTTSYNGPFPGAAALQPDGKILVIGQGFIPGGGVTLVLARYLAG